MEVGTGSMDATSVVVPPNVEGSGAEGAGRLPFVRRRSRVLHQLMRHIHMDRGGELEKIKYKTKAGAKKTKRTRKREDCFRLSPSLLRRHYRGSECSWRCLGTTIDAMGEEAFTGSLHARRFGDA